MTDLTQGNQSEPWLRAELARQFSPVSAPDSLWNQIHEQRRPLRVQPRRWTTWSLAAAAVLMLLAGLAWRLGATRNPADNLEELAGLELRTAANGTGRLDFRSSDPAEIRRWLKVSADIDVQLAEPLASGNDAVRLVGARILRRNGFSGAVVSYRVGDDSAAMLVTNRHAGPVTVAQAAHGGLRTRSSGNMRLYSWSQGPEDYAMAFGVNGAPHRPCLLCHAGSPAMLVLK